MAEISPELTLRPLINRSMRWITTLLFVAAVSGATAAEIPFSGHWKLNYEESDKLAVDYEEGSGIHGSNPANVNVSVMGLPLPSRIRQQAMSGLPPRDPEVLRCTTMNIVDAGKKLEIDYDAIGSETLVDGDYRGRRSSWSKKKIEQRYKTPERKITKTWTMRDDGMLLVTVVVNPTREKKRSYQRVFERYEPGPSTAH